MFIHRHFFGGLLAALLSLGTAGFADALTITTTNDANALLNSMLGSGGAITVTSVTYNGSGGASGTYTAGPLGIADGALFTSGDAQLALPPSDSGATTKDNNLPGDPLCNALIPGYTSYDATKITITFDLAPGFDGISFNFIFGSEEYPEYVGTAYNDVFGAYLNGNQVAFDAGGNPITINGPFFSGGAVVVAPATQTEYDGSTQILQTQATATGGSIGNVLTFVVCDAGDRVLGTSETTNASLRFNRGAVFESTSTCRNARWIDSPPTAADNEMARDRNTRSASGFTITVANLSDTSATLPKARTSASDGTYSYADIQACSVSSMFAVADTEMGCAVTEGLITTAPDRSTKVSSHRRCRFAILRNIFLPIYTPPTTKISGFHDGVNRFLRGGGWSPNTAGLYSRQVGAQARRKPLFTSYHGKSLKNRTQQ